MPRRCAGPLLLGLVLWQCWSTTGFLGGCARPRGSRLARRAYDFEIATSKEHSGLLTEVQEDGALRLSTRGKFMKGNWNTVLGSAPLPAKGRMYWEVKIVKKPTEAWEHIGVAEPTADVTVPLTKNRKGKGWFWGSTWTDSFVYIFLENKPEWYQQNLKNAQEMAAWWTARSPTLYPEKDLQAAAKESVEGKWTGPGTHVGTVQHKKYPPFENGMVIGVDVDMDEGSLAFWADGKFLGTVKDTEGKPVNLKGKKVVPALSIYGRHTGMHEEFSVFEIRTGLEPPPRP